MSRVFSLMLCSLLSLGCGSSTEQGPKPPSASAPVSPDCQATDDSDALQPAMVFRSHAAKAGRWPQFPACPTNTERLEREVGIGVSDLMHITELICQRPDGTRHGSYIATTVSLGLVILESGQYADGLREGRWRSHYGGRNREGTYQHGLKEDEWVAYHANGAVAWKGDFHCGLGEGKFQWSYPDGVLQREGIRLKGLPEGIWRDFWPSGAVKAVETWKGGEKLETRVYEDSDASTPN